MKNVLLVLSLFLLSLTTACFRARTPDGKLYTCAAHNRPITESKGPFPTYWVGNTQYSCFGPQNFAQDKINGQKETLAIVPQSSAPVAQAANDEQQ